MSQRNVEGPKFLKGGHFPLTWTGERDRDLIKQVKCKRGRRSSRFRAKKGRMKAGTLDEEKKGAGFLRGEEGEKGARFATEGQGRKRVDIVGGGRPHRKKRPHLGKRKGIDLLRRRRKSA